VTISRTVSRSTFAFAALTAVLALGCNKKESGGAAASSEKGASACEAYQKKVCTEAGEASETCKTIKSAAELIAPAACEKALASVDFTLGKVKEKKKKCDELVTKLCGDLGKDTETCKMVTEKTKEFPPDRCEMMLEHYAEVLTDLKKQEDRLKPLDAEKSAKIATGEVPAFGPKDAKVTIVEFSDFECPFCSRAADVAHKVKEKYGDKVRFVFRQFPLSFHPNAHVAAEAALAANAEGKFWEFHDKLFANQRALSREQLEGYAKELGLNVANFKSALDSKKFAATVDAEQKLGEEVAVDGTPTMFLNGARVANPTDFDTIATQIDKALAGG
jgi:protein-disulfide isomerase